MDSRVAIITADIVHSTQKEAIERKQFYHQIELGIQTIQSKYAFEYERNRGDEYQIRIKEIKNAGRIGILLKLWVKSIPSLKKEKNDIRVSVGIGTEDLTEKRIAESDGDAYLLSGRGLDHIKNAKQRFLIQSKDNNHESLQMTSSLVDVLLDKMTSMQSIVVFYKLLGYTEIEIAQKLQLGQPTINQHSRAAHWTIFYKFVHYLENLYHHEFDDPSRSCICLYQKRSFD